MCSDHRLQVNYYTKVASNNFLKFHLVKYTFLKNKKKIYIGLLPSCESIPQLINEPESIIVLIKVFFEQTLLTPLLFVT